MSEVYAKTCVACGEQKDIEAFNRDRSRPSGRHPYCKACVSASRKQAEPAPRRTHCKNGHELTPENTYRSRRQLHCRTCQQKYSQKWKHETQILWKYGIGADDYDALLATQGGVCAICGGTNQGVRLVIDHNHTTGQVRGLLCAQCNFAVGHLGDDPERARRLADYIEHPPAEGFIETKERPTPKSRVPNMPVVAMVESYVPVPQQMGKLSAEQRAAIRERIASGTHGTYTALAEEYGVCQRTIRDIAKGRTWESD